MKKNFFTLLTIVAMTAVMNSCDNSTPKMDGPVVADSAQTGGMRIAYIEIDSLTAQYEFAKETSLELEKKGTNARNTIQSKSQQLERNVANFQQKLQNNGFTSREQAENAQASLQREQNNLMQLQQRLETELANEQAKFLQAFQDSLDHFLADYNADKKYDLIVNKAAVLLADKKYDITEEVINGMNRRYKKGATPVDTTKTK
ncbi:MAG: OmpH family outer membrane protein [Prevotella sp.]|nr:OmpH family outer membrane protein [Prevotella sp.]MDE6011703.1 OmpH family outer membrane protein [Prevotella sp.]